MKIPKIVNTSILWNPINWGYVLACVWAMSYVLHLILVRTNPPENS